MFRDRKDAGIKLAEPLSRYKNQKDVVVLGLARGGVAIAYEVAKQLGIPLNVVVPRKIGAPGMPEYAIGAIMEDGKGRFNDSAIRSLQVSQNYLTNEINRQKETAHERLALFRQYAPLPELKDRTVILVDDGIATGATMLVAIDAMRRAGAGSVVVAVPVAATDSLQKIQSEADEVVCLEDYYDFGSVSQFYDYFDQVEDEEVVEFLKKANVPSKLESPQKPSKQILEVVKIKVGKDLLDGEVCIPAGAKGLIVFVHGSGSNRFSPRNQAVAKYFNQQGIATLLVDLLTSDEDRIDSLTRQYRFDINLLVQRLKGITEWLSKDDKTKDLLIGFFGSSTGAAAALIGAAEKGPSIRAVVSRGGRTDLAGAYLSKVKSPTLFIVGGDDTVVVELNEESFESLTCEKDLKIISGATHLFEEPGTLEEVARLAANWFASHFK